MALFKSNQIPTDKKPKVITGRVFEVKNGEYIAEIPDGEAKQMESFGWGSIKADTPKQKDKK